MATAAVLGFLQGLVEWLPVSSEGVVAGVYALIFDASLDDAVRFALWLHVGTVPSVLIALRRDIMDIVREFLTRPHTPSPTLRFLVVATLVSGVVGLPLLLALSDISSLGGTAATGLIGCFMLVTGYVQLRRREESDEHVREELNLVDSLLVGVAQGLSVIPGLSRSGMTVATLLRPREGSDEHVREELNLVDSLLVGVAQGLSVIPGLSRSGMTVAVLLSRRVDAKRALTLSFLLSVPASLAASIYVGIDSGLVFEWDAILAAGVAFVVGLVTIRGLMAVAMRVNFGWFVVAMGAFMMAGAFIAWVL